MTTDTTPMTTDMTAQRGELERRLAVVAERIDFHAPGCSRTNARPELRFARRSLSSAADFLSGRHDKTACGDALEAWRLLMATQSFEEAAYFTARAEVAAGIAARAV